MRYCSSPAAVIVPLALYYRSEKSHGVKLAHLVRNQIPGVAAASLVAFVIVWAGYRFDISPITKTREMTDRRIEALPAFAKTLVTTPVPASALPRGVLSVYLHNRNGHNSYLLGKLGATGWWYFFPVVLGVKTPLAFIILLIIGAVAVSRNVSRETAWIKLAPLLGATCMLLICLPSKLNLGRAPYLANVSIAFLSRRIRSGHVVFTGSQSNGYATVSQLYYWVGF